MFKQVLCPLAAILAVLAGCSKSGSGGDNGEPSAVLDAGARIYSGNCTACHQQDARGVPGVYPSLVGSRVLLGDPQVLARWVVKGERPASMPEGRYATKMPQFGWLKRPDAASLFTYLRSGFGNEAAPVAAIDIGSAWGE